MAVETPESLKHAIIYEVFPRNHTADGNLKGITKDLERIRKLGADIIWLMPVHPIGRSGRKGKEGSPYAIKDYRQIDVHLGDEDDFKELIYTAHNLGLKVMMDIVYNHTANDSVLCREYPSWFYKDDKGRLKRKFADWSDVLDLDYNHSELWNYQIETLKYWVDFGVDGFRCDVAPMVPVEFWIKARSIINKRKKAIWLAESVEKSFVMLLRNSGYQVNCDPILHHAFDLTYDYDGMEYLKQYFRGNGELKDYINHLYIQETMYPDHAVKMRFLENHDTPRIASIIGDKTRLKNWTLFYSLLPGTVLIYSGQEYAMAERPDLFNRDLIDWNNGDKDFYEFMSTVLHAVKTIKRKCSYYSVKEIAKGIIMIKWWNEEEEFLAIINLEDRYGIIDSGVKCTGIDLLTNKKMTIKADFSIGKNPILIKVNKK